MSADGTRENDFCEPYFDELDRSRKQSRVRDAILTPKVYSPRPIAGSDNNREFTTTPLMLLKRPRARAVKETRE